MGDDFLLLRRIHQGDESAIEEFVRKYYPLILRYCRFHLLDSAEAEDVTQEVFARFFRTLPQYRHSGKLANYLYVIAGNLCRDSFKKPRPLPLEDAPEQSQELSASMPERVWLCQVPKGRIDAFLKALKVSNVKNTPEGAELRIISAEQPTDNAVQVVPTLEDVFLSYFGQRGGEANDAV